MCETGFDFHGQIYPLLSFCNFGATDHGCQNTYVTNTLIFTLSKYYSYDIILIVHNKYYMHILYIMRWNNGM
jgi:hypothetical protein